jgi:hypothetical protein
MEKDVPDVPNVEHGQGRVQGIPLADRPKIEIDPPGGSPALGPKPGHLETMTVRADTQERLKRPRRGRSPPAGRPSLPEIVDVERAVRLGLDKSSQAQDLGCLDPDPQGVSRPEPPDPADLA